MNIPTRIIRLLVKRGHAMLLCELQAQLPGCKDPRSVANALDTLKMAKLVSWTTQGWMASEQARTYVALNRRLMFGGKP